MNAVSIPVVAITGVIFYVGFYHLLVYFSLWESENLTFALACFLAGFYDVFSIGLYNATSVEVGVRWQYAQFIALALASIAFLWFVDSYTSKVRRWARFTLSAIYLLAAVIAMVDRSGLVWSDQPAIKFFQLSFGLTVTYYEMASGPVADLTSLVGVGLFVCLVSAGIRLYRDGERRRAVPFVVSMVFFFIGVFNDSAVASGLYEFVYLMEYAYLAIVLLMTRSLTQRVVHAALLQGELERERDLVARIMETSPVGIVVVARDGQITFANRRAEKIFRLSRDEVGERTYNAPEWQITDYEGNPFPDERLPFRQVMATSRPVHDVRHAIELPGGERVYLSINAAPLFDERGQVGGMVASIEDISKRKQAEDALVASERKYRNIIESIPLGMHVYQLEPDGQLVFVDANPAADRILGVDNRQFINKTIEEAFPALIDLGVPDKYRRVAETGEPWSVDQIFYDENRIVGAFGVHAFQTSPGRMVAAFFDVTERVEAQEEMLRWRRLLENVTDSMPSVLITLDLAGRVLTWNPAAEELTGQTMEEVRGRLIWRVCPALGRYRDLVDQVLETGQGAHQLREPIGIGGILVYRDVSVFPLVANGVDGVVVRIDDVTQRVQLEEMMLQSAKMASVGGLAAGVAHEINNPLGAMMQSAQMLHLRLDTRRALTRKRLSACGVDPDGLERYIEQRGLLDYVDGIRQTGARAAKIVTDLLHFSRRSDSKIAPNDLNGLVQQVLDLAEADYDLKKRYDFRDVDLVWDLDPDLPPVLCDGQQIQQVVLNLVRNAAQAMAEQKKRDDEYVPWLRLRTSQKKRWARLEVEDNGPGIPGEIRDRLFKPFFTTKSPQEGTGLGLWLSWSIVVERHKGRMRVELSERGGARFVVELPLT